MYCEKPGHRSSDCKTAKPMTERRKTLSDKNLCFSCIGAKHRVTECCRAKTWLKCKNKHHASMCDKLAESKSEPISVTTEIYVTYLVVIIKVNPQKCRALLDTGSCSLYISESFINLLKINPVRKEYKTIKKTTKFHH